MPQDSVGRRPGAASASASLVSVLARTPRLIDQLPALHQHALERTGGTCSILFEYNPRDGGMQSTSGFGLDALVTEPWTPADREASIVERLFAEGAPMLVADLADEMPDLATRLGHPAALLLPLQRGTTRVGIVAIGYEGRVDRPPSDDVADAADAFFAAIELARLRRSEELQRDIRDLLDEFAAALSSSLNVTACLEMFCRGANRLFGADRTSVWVHDRRGRQLVLQGSSDPAYVAAGARVAVDDPLSPAAGSLRRLRAELLPGEDETSTATITVPLRGCRRALGTIVFDGVRVEPGGEIDLLDRSDELGRQLASAIENMQLLDEVLRSRRELENTFDSIADLVIVSDRTGRIAHVNQAFAERSGTSRELLLDRRLADCVGPALSALLEARETEAADPREPRTCEIDDPVLGGRFGVTITDLLTPDRERTGSVVVARDLTRQTELEAEREELRKRLTQTEKLAALGQFVAGIAHELNNPLQGVLGHLELLRVTGAFPKQIRREVQTIYREADRAAKIVRNLLVFAGSRRLARRSVSVNAIVQKVAALRSGACRAAGIEVVRHYDEKLPRAQIDPLLLHQTFLNIVMNAEQAIAVAGRAAGRIEIETKLAPGGDRIVVTVRDNGGGIPPDALPHVFEPFYTTKEVGKGTGLGLAIAYGIIQEHGGHIHAANDPGGAILTIELPAIAARGRGHHD